MIVGKVAVRTTCRPHLEAFAVLFLALGLAAVAPLAMVLHSHVRRRFGNLLIEGLQSTHVL